MDSWSVAEEKSVSVSLCITLSVFSVSLVNVILSFFCNSVGFPVP